MKPVPRPMVEELIRDSTGFGAEDERTLYRGNAILVVLASWNEAGKVGPAVSKVPRDLVDRVVVVDNGSVDGTGAEAEAAGATVVRHPWNAGAGGGYRTGYWYGLMGQYDIIVELAGDDQDDPNDIKHVVDRLLDDDLDYVQGSRWLPGGDAIEMTRSRTMATKLYSWLMSVLFGQRVTDGTNGFRAFRTKVLKDPAIRLWQDWLIGYELEPYLLIQTIRMGYRFGEEPVRKIYHPAMEDNTKMTPFKSWYSILRPLFLLKLGIRS